MACKYFAPNGMPSKLYDNAAQKYNDATALSVFTLVQTPEFKDNYQDKVELDVNKEPTLGSLEQLGLVGKVPDFVQPLEASKEFATKKKNLVQGALFNAGIDIAFEEDTTMDENAKVMTKNNRTVIKFNPNKVRQDTFFHEAGHVYVDMLGGLNNSIIKAGVAKLKDTKLWNDVAKLYPDLTESQLAKEVLTTAIGIEANKLFKEKEARKSWSYWLNRLFRAIGDLLGINKDLARDLARDLINQDLSDTINTKIKIQEQQQRDFRLVNNVFQTKEDFVKKAKDAIAKKIETYYRDLTQEQREKKANYKALKELEDALNEYTKVGTSESILKFVEESYKQTGKLEERMDTIINPTAEDIAAGNDEVSAKDLQNLINYNSTFSLVEDLIDLMQSDTDLKKDIEDAGLLTHVSDINQRFINIKKATKRIAISLLAEKFAKRGNGKMEAMRRQELEREFNLKHKEERAKLQKGFNPGELKKFKERRKKYIDSRIEIEKRELYRSEVERYQYLLQQSNQDIGWMDRMFIDGDALNDDIIQVATEILDEADFDTMTKANEEYKVANEIFEEFHKARPQGNQEKKYDEMIEDEVDFVDGKVVKTGNKSRYMTGKYYSKFYEIKNELYQEYLRLEDAGYTNDANIALQEYIDFINENTVKPIGSKKRYPTLQWQNPNYTKLMRMRDTHKAVFDMYNYLTQRIATDDAGLPHWAQLRKEVGVDENNVPVFLYKLPSIHKKGLERMAKNGVINEIKDNVRGTFRKEDATEYGGDTASDIEDVKSITGEEGSVAGETIQRVINTLTNEQGEEKHRVPINFRYNMEAKDQSYDLLSGVLLNQFMALNYTNKNKIAADLELTQELLAEREVIKTKSSFMKGIRYMGDKLLNESSEETTPQTFKGEDSNSYKAYNSMIQDRLYGIASLSNVTANKIASKVLAYTGGVMLIGNYLSSGANLFYGDFMNWIEATGGEFFDTSDMAKAHQKYMKELASGAIIGDIGKRVYKSRTNLLIEKFNMLGDWSAVANKFVADSRFKQLAKTSSLHALNSSAEHFIQAILMYGVLNNIKVKDVNGNYLTKDGTTTDITKAMSLDEAYTVKDGRLVLDDRVDSTTESNQTEQQKYEFLISRKMRDLNAYMQGQYAHDKRSEIQRYWWGNAILMLRKWIPRGLKRRWRGLGTMGVPVEQMNADDKFYSRALGTFQEGYYVTAGRFIWTLVSQGKALKKEMITADWAKLTDGEQANIKKAVMELVSAAVFLGIAVALKGLGDDEDDPVLKNVYYTMAFFSLRLQKELVTFVNPAEISKTVKSPSAAIIMVDRTLHFLSQFFVDGFNVLTGAGPETYKTGRRKGELKIQKDFEDLVPLVKNLDRNISESLSYLFSRRIN